MRSHFLSTIREWTFFREVWQQIIRKSWSFLIWCSMFDFNFFLLGALGPGLTTSASLIKERLIKERVGMVPRCTIVCIPTCLSCVKLPLSGTYVLSYVFLLVSPVLNSHSAVLWAVRKQQGLWTDIAGRKSTVRCNIGTTVSAWCQLRPHLTFVDVDAPLVKKDVVKLSFVWGKPFGRLS